MFQLSKPITLKTRMTFWPRIDKNTINMFPNSLYVYVRHSNDKTLVYSPRHEDSDGIKLDEAWFCVAPVDTGRWALSGLVAGRAGPSAGRGAEVRNRGGAAPARSLSGRRAHGSVARLVPH